MRMTGTYDFDEPMMPGSDDEFSDCDYVDSDDDGLPLSPFPQTPPPAPLPLVLSLYIIYSSGHQPE